MKQFLSLLVLLLVTACASPLVQSPTKATTTAPHLDNHQLTASDNTALPLHQLSGLQQPSAVIIGLHGFNDYGHAFSLAASYFNQHRIKLIAYDQRGFGRTSQTGIWAGNALLISDVIDMVHATRQRYPEAPLYLLGESMGGAVAIAAASRSDFPDIDGLILSAPAVWGGDTMNPLYRAALWCFAHSWPGKLLTGENMHILPSDNIPMLRALSADPHIIKATRIDAIYGLVQLMDSAYRSIEHVSTPTLVLYGANDQVIPEDPIKRILARAPKGTRYVYYPKGYHMLLRDLHREIVFNDIIAWIHHPDAMLPSGAEQSLK